MDETSIDSIDEVRASEFCPKKPLQSDDISLTVPFPLLCGEGAQFIGRTTEGTLILSNYRLYHIEGTFFNIPIGLIDFIECRDIFFLYIFCKDGRSFRCTFTNSDECQKWLKRLQTSILTSEKLEDHFAFAFYSWTKEEQKEAMISQLHQPLPNDVKDDLDMVEITAEVERMGFDLKDIWKISKVNIDYQLCPSYPQYILVPALIHDELLLDLANFRYSRRIPAVVWRHQQNGCVIARSSQPKMGILSWRNFNDENLIQAISDACVSDPGFASKTKCKKEEMCSIKTDIDGEMSFCDNNQNEEVPKRKLLIVDARSYAAAMTNRAKGGGYECDGYYSNCEIQYMGLANIHTIRKSFSCLRTLCATPDEQNWLSSLENTKWLHHISGLIRAASLVVNAVDVEKRPVLVHCSDGWDRTPQIVALAELMLDPFYRTKKGFKILVEREWLEYGHKFADRCGHSDGTEDTNERCPVFLQWLDCVFQIVYQFPCHFEFNQQYLARLLLHTYSCLFGTFLCNTDQSRRANRIPARTFSVWPVLNERSQFHNYLFNHSNEVLRPSFQIRDLEFWKEVYLPNNAIDIGGSSTLHVEKTLKENVEKTGLVKTKSCDNISCADHSSNLQRHNSDPNLVDNTFTDDRNQQITNNEIENSESSNPESLDVVCNGFDDIATDASENIEEKCDAYDEPIFDGSTDTLVSDNTLSNNDLLKESESCPTKEINDFSSREDLPIADELCKNDLPLPSENYNVQNGNVLNHDGKLSAWCQSVLGAYITSKRNSDSSDSCNCSYVTPHHSRTPSSGFPATPCDDPNDISAGRKDGTFQQILDVDGLVIVPNAIQERIKRLIAYYKSEIASLQNQLSATRNEIFQQLYRNQIGRDGFYLDVDDNASVADSACSGEQHLENNGSEKSWEQLDHPYTILWVPDHAVSNCTGCEGTFWVGRRKHHCRKCGRVFCSRCSSRLMPVPTEQLFDPVRVCNFCFEDLQSQCRQVVTLCDKVQKTAITAASN